MQWFSYLTKPDLPRAFVKRRCDYDPIQKGKFRTQRRCREVLPTLRIQSLPVLKARSLKALDAPFYSENSQRNTSARPSVKISGYRQSSRQRDIQIYLVKLARINKALFR